MAVPIKLVNVCAPCGQRGCLCDPCATHDGPACLSHSCSRCDCTTPYEGESFYVVVCLDVAYEAEPGDVIKIVLRHSGGMHHELDALVSNSCLQVLIPADMLSAGWWGVWTTITNQAGNIRYIGCVRPMRVAELAGTEADACTQ